MAAAPPFPSEPPACWHCGQPTAESHFCPSCRRLQPPGGDYFSYLGLPQKLGIDLPEMEQRFHSLSRRLHPDVFFQRVETERQLSVEAAAFLNDAYRTLKNPLTRAEYLLALHGIRKNDPRISGAPLELLEEVFELKTTLDQIRDGDETAQPQLVQAREKIQKLLAEADRALDEGFANWDATGQRQTLERIAAVLTRRAFLRKLLEDSGVEPR